MIMNIKFSHDYGKLQVAPDRKATLLDVVMVNLQELSDEFLSYDTDDVFKLAKTGSYMMLLFKGQCGLFTTLRSAYPLRKVDYYRAAIGKEFNIVITL